MLAELDQHLATPRLPGRLFDKCCATLRRLRSAPGSLGVTLWDSWRATFPQLLGNNNCPGIAGLHRAGIASLGHRAVYRPGAGHVLGHRDDIDAPRRVVPLCRRAHQPGQQEDRRLSLTARLLASDALLVSVAVLRSFGPTPARRCDANSLACRSACRRSVSSAKAGRIEFKAEDAIGAEPPTLPPAFGPLRGDPPIDL